MFFFVNSSETKETGIWESYDVDYDVLVEPLRELYQRKTLDLKRKEFLDIFLNDGDNP